MSQAPIIPITIEYPDGTILQLQVTGLCVKASSLELDTDTRNLVISGNLLYWQCDKVSYTECPPPIDVCASTPKQGCCDDIPTPSLTQAEDWQTLKTQNG